MGSDVYCKYDRRERVHYLFGEADIDQHIVYSVSLMRVYEHEKSLDVGRFSRFTKLPLDHRVQNLAPKAIEEMVNWVAEHLTCAWSIQIHEADESLDFVGVDFLFSDLMSAAKFKLVFG